MRGFTCIAATVVCLMSFAVPAGAASEAQLDRLLAARDWKTLDDAVYPFKDPSAVRADLAWLGKKVDGGEGGFYLAGMYGMHLSLGMMNLDPQGFLSSAGAKNKPEDPDKNLQVASAMYGLYAIGLTVVDGAACSSASPIHYWLSKNRAPADLRGGMTFLRTFSAAGKASIVDRVVKLEARTASLRGDDETLCKGGVDEPASPGDAFEAVVIAGQQRTNAAPAAGADIFLPPDEAAKARERARAHLRETLTKLLQ